MKIKITKCVGTIYWCDIPEELRVYYPQQKSILGFKKEKELDEGATCSKLESVLKEKGSITKEQYLFVAYNPFQPHAIYIYEDVYL